MWNTRERSAEGRRSLIMSTTSPLKPAKEQKPSSDCKKDKWKRATSPWESSWSHSRNKGKEMSIIDREGKKTSRTDDFRICWWFLCDLITETDKFQEWLDRKEEVKHDKTKPSGTVRKREEKEESKEKSLKERAKTEESAKRTNNPIKEEERWSYCLRWLGKLWKWWRHRGCTFVTQEFSQCN